MITTAFARLFVDSLVGSPPGTYHLGLSKATLLNDQSTIAEADELEASINPGYSRLLLSTWTYQPPRRMTTGPQTKAFCNQHVSDSWEPATYIIVIADDILAFFEQLSPPITLAAADQIDLPNGVVFELRDHS